MWFFSCPFENLRCVFHVSVLNIRTGVDRSDVFKENNFISNRRFHSMIWLRVSYAPQGVSHVSGTFWCQHAANVEGEEGGYFCSFFLVCTSQSTVLRPKFCQHVCLQNLGAAYDAEQSLSLCFVFCFAFVRNTLCYSTFKTWGCQNGATNTWFFCKCVAMKMPICISSCCKPFRQCETRPPWLKFWIQSSHFLRGRCGLCPRHDGKFSSQCHNGSMQV